MMTSKQKLSIIGLAIGLMLFGLPLVAGAQAVDAPATEPITFKPELAIPGLFSGETVITGTSIVSYVRVIFIMFIWTVGILATVMVIYGGIKWVAAAGNPGRINDARDVINNAIIGVVIALTSIVLLNTINPSLVRLRGIDINTVRKELTQFYSDVDSSIAKCTATLMKGDPDHVCGDQGCSATGTLNDWSNEAAAQSSISLHATDPFIVKAIISQESLLNGIPYSRDTQVKNADGSPASSAYGIGQFVAGTLYEQLRAVRINAGGLPSECPENNKVVGGHLNPTCKVWLDQPTSPTTQLVGLKAQVFMVENYLNVLSTATCVQGNLGRMAAAYYLGAGGVRKYCQAEDLVSPDTKTTAEVTQRIQEARQYVAAVQRFYSQYCLASQ